MKKPIIRTLALLLVCICFIGIFAPAVQAAETTKNLPFTGSSNGGTSKYIYVKTDDTEKSKSVKLTFYKGTLDTTNDRAYRDAKMYKTFSVRAAYEIKICYRSGKTWKQEDSYDVYNKPSKTVTLDQSNTYYRIQVYQWRASTTLTSYKKNGVVSYSTTRIFDQGPYWSKVPTFKVGSPSKVTIYTSNPF